MGYSPVFLDLDKARCLVIGGGTIAERKVEALLAAGGEVTLISPELTAALRVLEAAGRLTVQQRPYQREDLDTVSLVIAATDDPTLQRQIAADAKQANILCNEDRQRLLTSLAESPLLAYLRARQTDKLDALLQRTLGEAYTLERLAFSW